MTNFLQKSLSPQAIRIFKVLRKGLPMSAKEIGGHLRIFPNAVYRAAEQLMELGVVKQVNSYPLKFQAIPLSEGLSAYSSVMRQDFQNALGGGIEIPSHGGLLKLVFVQTRSQTIKMTGRDTGLAKESINLIVSGLQLPAETLLVNQRAVERGVRVRLLVQNLKEITTENLRSWKHAGVEIRYYPDIEARIYTFDHKIVYFTSYDPKDSETAIGMRFDYSPFARIIDELFEQRWKDGKEIGKL